MKYHLTHAHPRPQRGDRGPVRLDPAAEEALRDLSSILEDARENVFKEPIRATQLIDRAREWVAWLRDRSRPRPGRRGPGPERAPATGARRHVMTASKPPEPWGSGEGG